MPHQELGCLETTKGMARNVTIPGAIYANRVSGQFRRSPWTLERWSIAHGLRIKEILATAVELCSKTTMTMTGTPTTSYMMSLSKDEANAASPSSSVRALTSSSSNCVAVHAPRHRYVLAPQLNLIWPQLQIRAIRPR